MRNTALSLLLSLLATSLGCNTSERTSNEETWTEGQALTANDVWHTVHNIMVTANDVHYALKTLDAGLIDGPNSSQCPLTHNELRGESGATGTSFASLPTSTSSLSLFDSRFDRMYEQYSHCTPFSTNAMRAFAYAYSRQISTTEWDGHLGLFFMTKERCVWYVQRYWHGETCRDFEVNSHLQIAAGAAELRMNTATIQSRRPIGQYSADTLTTLLVAGHVVGTQAFARLAGYEPTKPREVCRLLFDVLWEESLILPPDSERRNAETECQKYR